MHSLLYVSLLLMLRVSLAIYCPHGQDSGAILSIEAAIINGNFSGSCCEFQLHCTPETGPLESLTISSPLGSFRNNQIPSELCQLKQLRSLKIGTIYSGEFQWSEQVPSCLHQLKNLTELHILGITNLSTTTVEQISTLTSLKNLELSRINLQASGFESVVLGLRNLKHVTIRQNNLSTVIPQAICSLTRLITLDVSSNNLLGEIPACLSLLHHLEDLTLSGNNLQGTIPHLGNLSRLACLELSENQLESFPSICNISRKILQLNLYGNDIRSPLPECLNFVPQLHLHNNRFYGELPASLFSGNTSMIQLSDNFFTGPVPEIQGKSIVVNLSKNLLNGTIHSHDWTQACSALQTLDLSNNLLSGRIPPQLGNCTTLQRISLQKNQLEGPLPETLGNLWGLMFLGASQNKLQGSIPETLGNCSLLRFLDLRDNFLTGSLGAWIYNLKQIKVLSLGSNKLEGSIPSQLGNFSYLLACIDLSGNRFQGRLPEQLSFPAIRAPPLEESLETLLSAFTMLKGFPGRTIRLYNLLMFGLAYLDMSGNELDGPIPRSIGNFSLAGLIDLSRNHLSGEIPSSIAHLQQLQALDLSMNKLSGGIPPEFTALTQLSYFNVSGNDLSGALPQGAQFNTFTDASYYGNARLCGFPIAPCEKVQDFRSTPPEKSRHLNLKVVVTAVVFVVLLSLVAYVTMINLRSSGKQIHSVSSQRRELWDATEGFRTTIGKGGHSTVYKGYLRGRAVAVKVYGASQVNEFLREQDILSSIKHRNIVKLVDSSVECKSLVMEFFQNGSLDMHLHQLDWVKRMRIAKGIANALSYLHEEATLEGQIVHGDLKPSNVLLDEEMEAHLADFGISKLFKRKTSLFSTEESGFKCSIGYTAPETTFTGKLTTSGDVYSYGIVLLEMLTGISPTSSRMSSSSLRNWVLENRDNAVDPHLRTQVSGSDSTRREFEFALNLGLSCSQENPGQRPRMREVAQALNLH